ncbi:MAG TPA: homoserine dehydrogenase, partial [Epsilonproteobacteria bacterium]|nr:homoserine dehydrogenase [Campylobacterota bacterium]
MVKVGILGLGTVGGSVARILQDNADIIEARSGKRIVVKAGVALEQKDFDFPVTSNVDDVLDDPEIDIIVEVMG